MLLATFFLFTLRSTIAIELDGQPGSSGLDLAAGILLWTVATLVLSALPVRLPDGVQVAVSTAPLVAAAVLGGPIAAGIVALVGTTEARELRGKVAWYGILANHAVIIVPIILGSVV